MNDELQSLLIQQLKRLNFWLRFFGVLTVVSLLIIGYLLFRIIFFIRDVDNKFDGFKQTTQNFDVKQQACDGEGSFSDLVRERTNACE